MVKKRNRVKKTHSPPAPSVAEKFWRLTESNFFMSGGVGIAIAGYAFIGSAPNFASFLLVAAWLVITISIYKHSFFEGNSKPIQKIFVMLISAVVAVVMFGTWLFLQPEQPDISLRLVYPTALHIKIRNTSRHAVIRDPRYIPVIWNLDGTDLLNPLPAPTRVLRGEWIRAGGGLVEEIASQPLVAARIKIGDRLFGFIQASCPDCIREKAYWLYLVHGRSGWYAEVPESQWIPLNDFTHLLPQIRDNPDAFLARIPQSARVPITDEPF